MKLIVLGNAGAGKSTFAQQRQREIMRTGQQVACLSLDQVAFQDGALRRPVADSVNAVTQWLLHQENWIVEGCYADIIEPILEYCEELIFLNPSIETCVAHCLSRPWEPEKFASQAEQGAHLAHLLAWVRLYETRTDEYGLARHRALYASFQGQKHEFTQARQYAPL